MENKTSVTVSLRDAIGISSWIKLDYDKRKEALKNHVIDKQNLAYSFQEYQEDVNYNEDLGEALKKFNKILDSTSQIQELHYLFSEMKKSKTKGGIKRLFENVELLYFEKITFVLTKKELEVLNFEVPI